VAEAAARHKSQHPISDEPLDAMRVYRNLGRISGQSGQDSEHRRGAILRGLFLDAEPVEAKYIARTVMRNVLVGLGPQTVIAAISMAFGVKTEEVKRAYDLMPELGLVAEAACEGTLAKVRIKPSYPVRPMLIRPGKMFNVAVPRAYVPKYPGLRVQVHKLGAEYFVYTIRHRDVTSALSILAKELLNIGHDFIADAWLVGFQDAAIVGLRDMVSYINRRNLSRRSKIVPALVAMDLLYLDEEDLTQLSYEERRKRLEAFVGGPKGIPFTGISTAEQVVLDEPSDVEKYLASSRQKGQKGLIVRDLLAPYRTGRFSDVDFSIRAPMEKARAKNSGS
jgi:DNA ligase 1